MKNKQIDPKLAALMGLIGIPVANANAAKHNRPNIIYIMADDMGYGDLGCYGQPYFETPNIDRMASEGMRFTQAYAGAPVSAPSRATILTGQHMGHTRIRGNKSMAKKDDAVTYGKVKEWSRVGQMPLDPNHITLFEIFKQNGYATSMFGKWGLGYEGSNSTPDKRGIDEFYGYMCQTKAHQYYPNFLNRYCPERGDTGVVREVLEDNVNYPLMGDDYYKRTMYSADLIHQRAMEWIDKQDKTKPFISFLTYTIPHAELAQPNDSLLKYYKQKFLVDKTWSGGGKATYNDSEHTHAQFAAMIARLDTYVGQIIQKLKDKGLDDNTIIIFTSDNGPHEEGGADPTFFGRDGKLRGLKRQCYEGGIRIPFIVRWANHIKAGEVNDYQLAFYDLMPTFCDLAGISSYEKRYRNKKIDDHFDGKSFAPTLFGNKVKDGHKYLYWEFAETDQIAVRRDDWKLIIIKGIPHLYNLATDIHEDHDVSKENPQIVDELIKVIKKEHSDSELFKLTMPK